VSRARRRRSQLQGGVENLFLLKGEKLYGDEEGIGEEVREEGSREESSGEENGQEVREEVREENGEEGVREESFGEVR
jgi:hypothetical protein